MNRAADPYRYVLEQPVSAPPGAKFNYSGGSTAILAAIVHKATGQPIDDFRRCNAIPAVGNQGFRMGENGEWRSKRRIGIAFEAARSGQDRPIVAGAWKLEWPPDRVGNYITQSTKSMFSAGGLYYSGYHWFIGRSLVNGREVDWFGARGLGGQRLFVVPSLDLVVVMTAGFVQQPA